MPSKKSFSCVLLTGSIGQRGIDQLVVAGAAAVGEVPCSRALRKLVLQPLPRELHVGFAQQRIHLRSFQLDVPVFVARTLSMYSFFACQG